MKTKTWKKRTSHDSSTNNYMTYPLVLGLLEGVECMKGLGGAGPLGDWGK